MRSFAKKTIRLSCAAILVATSLTFTLVGCTSPQSEPGANSASTSSGQSSATKPVPIKEGNVAPDFEFTTTDGTTAKLSDYQGRVVLLNFWASWCGYCIQEMPARGKLIETYPEVTAVAINRGDGNSKAIATAKDQGYNFVWGLDSNRSIEALYPANGIPFSVVIDKNGVISSTFEGSAPDMFPRFESAVKKAGA